MRCPCRQAGTVIDREQGCSLLEDAMPSIRFLMGLSGVAVLLGASSVGARPDDPPAKGPAELQGVWKLTALEVGGKPAEPLGGGEPRWVLKADRVFYGGAEIAQFSADPTTSPRVIDLKLRNPERVYEGVY